MITISILMGISGAIIIGVVGYMIRDGKKECSHYNSRTTFMDIHMGDRWYVRGWVKCHCGYKKCVAVPLPDSLDFRNLDLEKYWDEVRNGVHK